MKFKQLETIVNRGTHSTFYVVGETVGLKIGVRFWMNKLVTTGAQKTEVGFRARVEQKAGQPIAIDFKSMVSSKFPNAEWSGYSKGHASISGVGHLDVPPWNDTVVLKMLADNDVGHKFVQYIKNAFAGAEWFLTDVEFEEFFKASVMENLIKYDYPEGKKDSGCVVLQFDGGQKLKFKDGSEVFSAEGPQVQEAGESVLDEIGLTGVDFTTGSDGSGHPSTYDDGVQAL